MSVATKLLYTIGKTNLLMSRMKICTASKTFIYQKHFRTRICASNPLIDGPDFTYLDGRPTPLNVKQRRRAIGQKEAVEKAFKLMGHIDFAVKRSQEKAKAQADERERIQSSKFKEKGTLLE